jgi:hypothetical protein
MFKSILKNRVVLLLVSLFFSMGMNAQINMFDTWRINDLMGVRDLEEYSIVKMGKYHLGYMFVLNHDGTFLIRDLPQCGNGIFKNISGSFILIDDTHIRFMLNRISYSSYSKEDNSEEEPNVDLGIFYIYQDSKSIRLIKSNGNLQDDKDKMLYTEMLKTFDENWKTYEYSWVNTNENMPEEVVKDYLGNKLTGLSDYKIVYSKKEGYGELFLVRKDEDFHYVLYNGIKQKVSLAYPR